LKKILIILSLLQVYLSFGQIDPTAVQQKELFVKNRQLKIDSISISPYNFKITTIDKTRVPNDNYTVDFGQALVRFKDSIPLAKKYVVFYKALPNFLTKTYQVYDEKLILNPTKSQDTTFVNTAVIKNTPKPFDGLKTKGNFARGVTVGNNQDLVVNSALDLQISGMIKDGVSLKAVIRDDNLPRQQIGYSENIKEFDEVYMELKASNWLARGGDILLKNKSYFLKFDKKVQGALFDYQGEKMNLKASGALVKGQYGQYTFQGQEGNQGPYKIKGENNEVYLLLVNDSERVHANGRLLERGQDKDYSIDYQNAEIIFNPTFAIGNKDRITIEFQYTDRSYTRLITFGQTAYKSKKWMFSASFYNENDAKNNPLQQELNDTQKLFLSQAGDNPNLMQAPSELATSYSENKILYKKVISGPSYYYQFSNNPNDELFFVRFSNVGASNGSYSIQSSNAIGTIYEYVGLNNGDFEPTIRLIAPNKLQVIAFNAKYNPSEKTAITVETAQSNYDQNLFSSLDDTDNKANAFKLKIKQVLIDKSWQVASKVSMEQLDANFKPVERLQKIEFNYKWNIADAIGKQTLLKAGLFSHNKNKSFANYEFQQLQIGEFTSGVNHQLEANYLYKKMGFKLKRNLLSSKNQLEDNAYNYLLASSTYKNNKARYTISYESEKTTRTNQNTQLLNPLSRAFSDAKMEVQFGKANQRNITLGYAYILNDSIKNNRLEQKTKTNSYSLKTRFLQSKNGQGNLFINYRNTHILADNSTINTLNAKLDFKHNFSKKLLQWRTTMETFSGTLPQQEFTYIEAEQGLGYYKWNDYNGNNIQELTEFEVAQFQDEALYIRVLLPTKHYIKTFQTKFSQALIINPNRWQQSKKKSLAFLAKFYNQTNLIIDKKNEQQNNQFDFKPFDLQDINTLGLLYSLQNNLYFNRGKQHYSLRYEYLDSKNKTLLSIGLQEQYNHSDALYFQHKIKRFWIVSLSAKQQNSQHYSENNTIANYEMQSNSLMPKISYQANKNTVFSLAYTTKRKENTIGNQELLNQEIFAFKLHHLGNKQFSFDLNIQLYNNAFSGNTNSPVAYQMLAGLQAGKNQVWQLLVRKKINSFMDLNIQYNGRKATTSSTIHNGSVQLKAYF
jgi:hypothetical protein